MNLYLNLTGTVATGLMILSVIRLCTWYLNSKVWDVAQYGLAGAMVGLFVVGCLTELSI